VRLPMATRPLALGGTHKRATRPLAALLAGTRAGARTRWTAAAARRADGTCYSWGTATSLHPRWVGGVTGLIHGWELAALLGELGRESRQGFLMSSTQQKQVLQHQGPPLMLQKVQTGTGPPPKLPSIGEAGSPAIPRSQQATPAASSQLCKVVLGAGGLHGLVSGLPAGGAPADVGGGSDW